MEVGNVTRIGSLSRGTTLNDGVSSLFSPPFFFSFCVVLGCVRVIYLVAVCILLRTIMVMVCRIVLPWYRCMICGNLSSFICTSSSIFVFVIDHTLYANHPLALPPWVWISLTSHPRQTASHPSPTKSLTNHLIHDSFRPSSAAP